MANRGARHDLKRFLKDKRMSQTVLAAKLGVRTSTVNDILSGRRRPSLDLAIALAEATNIPAERF